MIFFKTFGIKKENSMYDETESSIVNILNKLSRNEKDFSDIKFLPPIGYTLVMTYIKQNSLDIKSFKFSNNVKSFLTNLNFYSSEKKIKNDYILPISTITARGDEEIIGNKFMNILIKKINNKESLLNGIQKIIGECLNNIIDHSGSDDYNKDGLCHNYNSGQYFQKKDFLQIAIVDGGVGILSSLRRKYPELQSGKEAIKKALQAKVSGGKTLSRENREYVQYSNRGIGLTTSLEIIKEIGGDIFIGSRDYIFSYCGKTKKENYINIKNKVWKGTFVVINIYSGENINININDIEFKILGIDEFESKISIDFGEKKG